MTKETVLLVFGGYSTEHYVSCESAGNILKHIDTDAYEVLCLGITLDGKWILTEASAEDIEYGSAWLTHPANKTAVINPIRSSQSILILNDGKYEEKHIDCVFPILHGSGGEDGCLQGLLELADIPYVGCGVAASACSMDKQLTRLFADFVGVKRPRSVDVFADTFNLSREEAPSLIADYHYPVYVKVACGGSSVGVMKVDKPEDLYDAIMDGFKLENSALIEEGIIGREINATVIGNKELEFGALCEIVLDENASFDYDSKYVSQSTSSKRVPADITDEQAETIRTMAAKMYKALGCENISRLDFFVSDDGEVYFNEINTLPGMRSHSIVETVFQAQGIPFSTLITKLINLAKQKRSKAGNVDADSIKIH